MSSINEKLGILLANQGWTQKHLADLLFVSPDAVSSWVRGINRPTVETIKQICEIFCMPIEDLINDDFDVPQYYVIGYEPSYRTIHYAEEYQDSDHTLIDAALAYEGILHRYENCKGVEFSAIYRGGQEVWWHYREHEARMIRDWNKEYGNDRRSY